MFKLSRSYLLLSLIFIFAFIYRILLMLRTTFPPSADIGLHNSVIYSITQSGNTDFLWNYYHMGEGVSLTFPGYHIFVSYIILMTGIPDYLAQAFVASLFSSLIVLAAFLITRKVWNEPAALIVAFLVAVSRFDIEMLMWGGYPNVVALMLIPLSFYLFLQQPKFSLLGFLSVSSLLCASIFLTHSLSAMIFVAVTFLTLIFATIFSRRFAAKRELPLLWIFPLFIGVIIILPFIVNALPAFLGVNQDTLVNDGNAVKLATLSTQSVAVDFIFPLILYVILIFLFSRKYHGKFLTVPAFLLSLWILIPALGTQSYIVGFYTDYNRFRYFVYLPVIILFGVAFNFISNFFAKAIHLGLHKIDELPKLSLRITRILFYFRPILSRRPLYAFFILVFLLYSLFSTSMFLTPSKGIEMQSFYQVIDQPSYEAIQWIKNYTASDSIIAADATYGWWISGFSQRQTYSGQEPQYLMLSREYEPAKNVKNLLDTNYILDNGLIQIREDGGYIVRHNPIFLAKLNNSYFPYSFFHFNNNEIVVFCRIDDINYNFSLSELSIKDMYLEKADNNASIFITRGNEFLNITQVTTLYQGVRFANMSLSIETNLENINLDWTRFILHTKYAQHFKEENFFALVDTQSNVGAQLIFTKNQPQTSIFTTENPSSIELFYNLNGNSRTKIEMFIGLFQIPCSYPDVKIETDYLSNLLANNTKTYADKLIDSPLDVFSYRDFIVDWNISYVVIRDAEIINRFRADPFFSLVFENEAVTIFKVNRGFQ